ncbi:DNA-deoxyinosine glycosylase [Adlercreutzia sp. ZJ154]|uniref:DNA-deoxyinosine glycosylase n=1 Tax=Adlercreutzia sp. ZJ154 TaxID=2709790 RepID=UPI001F14FCBF|nr:DNA-deoxyinosine glycosylase [Adlercreutzia sp. ZJ154]
MQQLLLAESSGNMQPRISSTRTLFGIKSHVEEVIEGVVQEENARCMRVKHTIDPVFDRHSHVLVLGTMPSPASRKVGFYYGHPQNRFWKVMAAIFGEAELENTEERKAFALRHGIALWDVLRACDIEGASDASIRNCEPNDLSLIIGAAPIRAIFTTGAKATQLLEKYNAGKWSDIERIALPSTSAANAQMSLAQLQEEYRKMLPYCC